MGRHQKQGLEYFPFDVDFFEDDKIQLISAQFGLKGEIVAIRLLCQVYRNGYYYKWGEEESLLLAKRVGNGITGSLVSEVVTGLVKRSFFDEGVFNSFQILTSRGIQRRYFEAVNRRIKVFYDPRIMLIDVSAYTNAISVNINEINDDISTQSKVKESKVKESKGEETGTPARARSSPPLLEDVQDYFRNAQYPDDPDAEAANFFAYYEAQNWLTSSQAGMPISNWRAKADQWMLRAQKEFKKEKKIGNNDNKSSHEKRLNYSFDEEKFKRREKELTDRFG